MIQWRRRIKQVLNSPALAYFGVRGSTEDAQPGDVNDDGNLIVIQHDSDDNPIDGVTPAMDGQSPDGVSVTALDTVIIPANPDRVALVMTNDSDVVMYIGVGESSAPNLAPRLNAEGGVYVLSKYGPIFSIEAIHASHVGVGNKVLTFQEFH